MMINVRNYIRVIAWMGKLDKNAFKKMLIIVPAYARIQYITPPYTLALLN
jgi:hypothetical protein